MRLGKESEPYPMKTSASLLLFLTFTMLCQSGLAATQDAWRRCYKCQVMFYDGFPSKGRCPGGGGHIKSSTEPRNFVLTYDVPENPRAQGAWRFCNKCHALFFDGYPQKGVCPAGAGHFAQGYVFVLPHDFTPPSVHQKNWRYCDRCHVMFSDDMRAKSRCPVGGNHHPEGVNFALRFRGNLEGDTEGHPADR